MVWYVNKYASLFIEFWWKLGICFCENFGILCDTECLWYDNNQFLVLFVKSLLGEVKHSLDGGVNDRFSQERVGLGRNGGGSSIDSDVLIGHGSCFLEG